MKTQKLPFNIEIMKVDGKLVKAMRPVTTTDIMGSSGQSIVPDDKKTLTWSGETKISSNFNPDGLFSTEIFGRIGEPERDQRFSFIDIKASVFHPIIYRNLISIKKLYKEIMEGKTYVIWNDEEKDFEVSDEIDGSTGFQLLLDHWEDIKLKQTKSVDRKIKIKLIEKYKDRALVNKVLVMPAGLRDIRANSDNRLEFDEINDIYRRLVGISKTISGTGKSIESPAMNYSRVQLQKAFNEIFDTVENMLKGDGKNGFMQAKWAKRKIHNGTRNVISSMETSKITLGGKDTPSGLDTVMGLYQLIKGTLELTIHQLRSSYLNEIFGVGDTGSMIGLVDPVTLKKDLVHLKPEFIDKWTTIDGIKKIINGFAKKENRFNPIMIEDRYLSLIYKGPDKTFKIFSDINDLPEGFDKKYVEPLTYIELIYLSGYRKWNDLKVMVSRYPVTGLGSAYPSNVYVKTTVNTESRAELDQNWQPIGEDHVAYEFPTKEPMEYIDSLVISPTRMNGLGADFDGDMCSCIFLYSDEAIEEINKNLASREAYVHPSGKLRTSVEVDTLSLVLRNMTGNYATK